MIHLLLFFFFLYPCHLQAENHLVSPTTKASPPKLEPSSDTQRKNSNELLEVNNKTIPSPSQTAPLIGKKDKADKKTDFPLSQTKNPNKSSTTITENNTIPSLQEENSDTQPEIENKKSSSQSQEDNTNTVSETNEEKVIPDSQQKNSNEPSDNKEEQQVLSHPQQEQNLLTLPTEEEEENKTIPLSFELEAEAQLLKNSLSRNQKDFSPHIPYAELSLKYSFSPDFYLFTQLEFASQKDLWSFDLEAAGLAFKTVWFQLKGGFMKLPLGYAFQNSERFAEPLYLSNLFTLNQRDWGLMLEAPLLNTPLKLTLSRFKGALKNNFSSDHRLPEFAPLIITLSASGDFWHSFAGFLKQNLFFSDPLTAWAGGFNLKKDLFHLKSSITGELWTVSEIYQGSVAYYLWPNIRFQKWGAGVLFSQTHHFSPNFKSQSIKSEVREWVFQGSYEFHPGVFLIGERFLRNQKKGPRMKEIWALRLKIEKEF